MAHERHFGCTACGKCCFGWLPLTLEDALAHAGRFPLAVFWTPVRQGARAFDLTAKIGLEIRLRDRRKVAVRIAPTGYIPPSFPCPALGADNLCTIHATKPSRCRTMPFFPYRDAADQADLLIPRAGWACDTSAAAPLVYADKAITAAHDFQQERAALLAQAPVLRAYGEKLMARVPTLAESLGRAALKPAGGQVIVSFATLLRHLKPDNRPGIAAAQVALLKDYETRTANQPALAEYHRNYGDWAWEMEALVG